MTDLRAAVTEYLAALDVSRRQIVPEYGKPGGMDHGDISRARQVRLVQAEQALRTAVDGD